MHLAKQGYVHRDVSSGNLIEYTSPDSTEPRGMLVDLEYAKEVAAPSSRHPDTITVCTHLPPFPLSSAPLSY